MKKSDLLAVFGTLEAIGAVFDPPITRSAVSQWRYKIPKLREYQIRELVPNIEKQIAATKPRRRQEARAS